MFRTSAVFVCVGWLLVGGDVAAAADDGCCHDVQCPQCRHVCKLSVEQDKEKHHCWEVECEPICIPKVKFPWEKCGCKPKCAKLKYVRVLKQVEYECPVCRYVWTPELIAERCDGPQCDVSQPPPLEVIDAPPGPTASRSFFAPIADWFKQ